MNDAIQIWISVREPHFNTSSKQERQGKLLYFTCAIYCTAVDAAHKFYFEFFVI